MTRLCALADLDATGAKGVTLGEGPAAREIVVVADPSAPQGVRAYANACPHLGATLETFPDRFLSADRRHLICTAHGARFRVEDGHCVGGPCKGKALLALAVTVEGGEASLAD